MLDGNISIYSRAALIFGLSLGVTVFILPALSYAAFRIGLVDKPNQRRKVHESPKALVGGLGIVLALIFTSLFFFSNFTLEGFFAGIAILAITGFLDDLRELGHRWKFFAQIAATVMIIVLGKTLLLSFGDLLSFGPIDLGILTIPMTIFCVVGVINALNMIDGLDGLAGGIAFIASAAFAVLSFISGRLDLFFLSLALSGAILGFLKYNWRPASLFMGDLGSLAIGFTLAFFSIEITQEKDSRVPPVTPLLILAVPITDTLVVMIKRAMSGKSPFHADKGHLHHILLRMGFSHQTTVLIILFMTSVFALIAVLGIHYEVPEHILFAVFIFHFFICFLCSFYIKDIYRLKLKICRKTSMS